MKTDTSDAFLVGEITIGEGHSKRADLCLPFPISSWETESPHHFSLPFLTIPGSGAQTDSHGCPGLSLAPQYQLEELKYLSQHL